MLQSASRILVARGKKLLDFDMKKDPPAEDDLLKVAIGPSGKLRAPTLIKGKTVLVGFHEEAYEEIFGK